MFKQEDRLNLANKDIYIINQAERIFKSWATLPVKNTKGELVPIELYKDAAPTLLLRQAALLIEHTHIVVGKLINIEFGIHPIYQVEGLLGTWQVFRHYPSDDQAWDRLQGKIVIDENGQELKPFEGISAGGRQGFPDIKGIIPWIATSEFSLTHNPAVRGATLVSMSMANSAKTKVLNTSSEFKNSMENSTDEKKPTLPQNEDNPKDDDAKAAKDETPAENKPEGIPPEKPQVGEPAKAAENPEKKEESATLIEIKTMLSQVLMLLTGAQAVASSLKTEASSSSAIPKPNEEPKKEEAKNEAVEIPEKKEETEGTEEKDSKNADAKECGKSFEAQNSATASKDGKPPSMDVANLDTTPSTETPRPTVASPSYPDSQMPVLPGIKNEETPGSTINDIKAVLAGTKQFDMRVFVKNLSAKTAIGG